MTISRDAIVRWITALAGAFAAERETLTALDAAIGDADHAANMDRGFQAVLGALPGLADRDIGALLTGVGMTLVSTVGGASGPLFGTLFLRMGAATTGKAALSLADWTTALEAGVAGVAARGKAQPGDKTMLDALAPAVAALPTAAAEGADLEWALRRSAEAAREGMLATVPLVARKGRASYLGERSAGHQDPGATSAYLLLATAAATLAGDEG
jgi:dihydroxyacetone kinase-like protein